MRVLYLDGFSLWIGGETVNHPLRLSLHTLNQFSALDAEFNRLKRAFSGSTNTTALKLERKRLADISKAAKALQVVLGQEIASVEALAREDAGKRAGAPFNSSRTA